ncbi:VpsD family glycosyltransferase [Microbulbifer marinus]|uniref:Glycosyltransferase involved in cell wall bisynthesis n=1 Tax=Microbulbifer marinus TaxID=658218 RepID=A0A1H4AEB0_9GAMM|nr:VpsD family glycosyltransferase [Microbulbifer marinus]SEA34088.1 Glycosyltransferase involved in cell wall bisynthesis [Microbulbifer marinus]
MMKKVLLVVPLSTLNWGEKNAGGVDSVCQVIIKYLGDREKTNLYYRILAIDPFSCVSYSGDVLKLSPYVEVVLCPKNESIFGFKMPSLITNLFRVRRQVRDFQPDIVHVHEAQWLIAISKKIRRIATIHSYKKICRKSVSLINDIVYERIIPRVSDIFTDAYTCVGWDLSVALECDVQKPISLIGNPVDEAYFTPGEDSKCEEVRLVTCALISRRKRIDRAIELLSVLKKSGWKVSLTVIGPNVDPDYFSQLTQQLKSSGLLHDVIFTGALSQSEIIERYRESSVGVFYSEQETFGMAPLEMLAAGLPLLTTPVGVLGYLRHDFEKVGVKFVDGKDLSQQVQKLTSLLGFNDNQAAVYLRNKFSVSGICQEYESLY